MGTIPFSRPRATPARRASSTSTALHFYQNKQLEAYASKETKRLTLRQLVFFGRSMTPERLLTSANYVRTELPVRIAHRIRDLQALPYVVVTQEGIARVYELYWEAFRKYPPITTLEENNAFCKFLAGLLNDHATVIPLLSLGLSLSSPYLPPDALDAFMKRMLVSRISRRVLAEHHIALTNNFNGHRLYARDPHVGVIFTGLNVARSVEHCAKLLRRRPNEGGWPEVRVDGHTGTSFAYIGEHLEYVVFELLKNSMRATIETHQHTRHLPPIHATIVAGDHDVGIRISDQGGGLLTPTTRVSSPADLFSFSHVRNGVRLESERIGALRSLSASEHGVRATTAEQRSDTGDDVEDKADPERRGGVGPHPRIGIGLPMSKIFATYFGGSLDMVSLDGWGTDVYLRLPKLGTNLEGIEV
ncbi:branched-chain alpha-ketoacid dehydrogenase [Schizophyllum amplum]|uniref:Protein-serine/threonine kinase n=1 Tax=Schizophyllum amplum TaxID=97359 RepID=A0A550CRV4_9AGAR|nr:branched-chain alpha-ketoacid dehydrogenase [Auriculariopsis ampla]